MILEFKFKPKCFPSRLWVADNLMRKPRVGKWVVQRFDTSILKDGSLEVTLGLEPTSIIPSFYGYASWGFSLWLMYIVWRYGKNEQA